MREYVRFKDKLMRIMFNRIRQNEFINLKPKCVVRIQCDQVEKARYS